jgi:16S rRNA A1518/A1519 N6-dimethyltransferase RsmA/KsgA/DIM1 with predicted DNA glycosylase/AP lyase activity
MTDTAISIFKELGLNRNVRAEEISTQMFLELTAKLKELSLI